MKVKDIVKLPEKKEMTTISIENEVYNANVFTYNKLLAEISELPVNYELMLNKLKGE